MRRNKANIIIPPGYDLDVYGSNTFVVTPDYEFIQLTDRGFGYFDTNEKGIDWFVNGAISKAIEEALKEKEVVKVLDVGGGPLSQAAFDIVSRYEKVWAVNVDPCLSTKRRKHPRLEFIQDDIIGAELGKNFDVVYSFQVLPNMNEERRVKAMRKIHDSMKDGGVALLDYGHDIQSPLPHRIEGLDYLVFPFRGRNDFPGEVVIGGSITLYLSFRKGHDIPPGSKSYETGNI